ncbi:MAG: hypothetical protein K6E31_05850 [bacterium]|nr:hypothetical protein [bacterium]
MMGEEQKEQKRLEVGEEEPDLVYPLDEEDLLRRVTGEVLRFREAHGALSDVEDVVMAVRRIAGEVREVMALRHLSLHRIDLVEMTRRHLREKAIEKPRGG